MRLGDMTTIGNLKAWMATSSYVQRTDDGTTNIDRMYQQAITRVSQNILAYLERPWILPRNYIDTYDGSGGDIQFMRNWPVLSVAGVAVNGFNYPPNVSGIPSFGFNFETWDGVPPGGPSAVNLNGAKFSGNKQSVVISYRAGYQVSNEARVLGAPESVGQPIKLEADQPYGTWMTDEGVVYAEGTAFMKVTGAPAGAGQYRVLPIDEGTPLSAPGRYEFNEADEGEAILISYGFVPAGLEQIAIELIMERLAYRNRVGEVSRTINDQVTVRYDVSAIPAHIKLDLQPYRSILMI